MVFAFFFLSASVLPIPELEGGFLSVDCSFFSSGSFWVGSAELSLEGFLFKVFLDTDFFVTAPFFVVCCFFAVVSVVLTGFFFPLPLVAFFADVFFFFADFAVGDMIPQLQFGLFYLAVVTLI